MTFADQLESHRPQMRRMAMQILRNEADAEDAAQSAIMKAWQHRAEFDGRAKLATWLGRITMNEALTFVRDSKPPRKRYLPDSLDFTEALRKPYIVRHDEQVIAKELLERAFAQRTPGIHALILREKYGYSYKEIARITGRNERAIKTRIARGRKLAKRRINEA